MSKRIGAVAIGAVLLLAAFAAMYLYAPVGAPAGYHFPHHAMLGGGMDALYEGVLVEVDGCVMTETRDTIVWPPGYGFEIRDGRLVVVGGGRVVGMGEPVAIGGGFVHRDDLRRFPLALGTAEVPCGGGYSSRPAAGPTEGAPVVGHRTGFQSVMPSRPSTFIIVAVNNAISFSCPPLSANTSV